MFTRNSYGDINGLDTSKLLKSGVSIIVLFVALILMFNVFEHLDASEIMVVQYTNGSIETFTTPGWHGQWFGTVTTYPKRFHYEFESEIQFSDRGHAKIAGSSDFDMPLEKNNLIAMHQSYRSADAVKNSLIAKGVDKSVFTVGSLMTSKESSAERRNDLIRLIENQIDYGVFMTRNENQEVQEDTGKYDDKGQPIMAKKMIVVTHLVPDGKAPGGFARQDKSATATFGIKTFNFAVTAIKYADVVEKQFQEQQALQMQIQRSMVERNTSEQAAITAEANGRRDAAIARAQQEVIKAEKTTEAETRRDVAKLERDAAELNKQKAILEGEGEAAKKRLVMQADGALTQKLAAYVQIHQAYAKAIAESQHPLTPSVILGGTGSGGNAALSLQELLTLKTVRDLGLDASVSK